MNYNSDKKYLSTAYSIGRQLAKEAVWSEDGRCNWLGTSNENFRRKLQLIYRTFNAGLYQGLSGIALYLAELLRYIPDTIIQEVLDGTVKNILQQHHEQPLRLAYSLYSGQLGVGWALWRIGQLQSNPSLCQTGLEIVKNLKDITPLDIELDVIEGAAGAIPILLQFHAIQKDHTFLAIAEKCGELLIRQAHKTDTAWTLVSDYFSDGATGYGHGSAGMGRAFLELYTITKKTDYLQAAQYSFQFERELFVPEQNNWRDLRETTVHPPKCAEYWCHGAPGIALSRLKAYQLTGEQVYLEEAIIGLDTTTDLLLKKLEQPSKNNFSLCHGLAGNATALLTGGVLLNNPRYIEVAQQVGLAGINLYETTKTDWPGGSSSFTEDKEYITHTPNLMLGNAGIGHFYLQLYSGLALPNVLLF